MRSCELDVPDAHRAGLIRARGADVASARRDLTRLAITWPHRTSVYKKRSRRLPVPASPPVPQLQLQRHGRREAVRSHSAARVRSQASGRTAGDQHQCAAVVYHDKGPRLRSAASHPSQRPIPGLLVARPFARAALLQRGVLTYTVRPCPRFGSCSGWRPLRDPVLECSTEPLCGGWDVLCTFTPPCVDGTRLRAQKARAQYCMLVRCLCRVRTEAGRQYTRARSVRRRRCLP
ncbi:hypothetical protein DENSPDRAFT_590728 [Dentipellis sp. KUC8613]|nr:hypothetical protein DENSPDRAFT_590728 [Dentipellis sp. KUC8613]